MKKLTQAKAWAMFSSPFGARIFRSWRRVSYNSAPLNVSAGFNRRSLSYEGAFERADAQEKKRDAFCTF